MLHAPVRLMIFFPNKKLADNTANTRVYAPGTVVNFLVDMEAHHTGIAVCVSSTLCSSPLHE